MSKVGEWKNQCSSNQQANSVQEAELFLKKHHELSDDISQIYAEVSVKYQIIKGSFFFFKFAFQHKLRRF